MCHPLFKLQMKLIEIKRLAITKKYVKLENRHPYLFKCHNLKITFNYIILKNSLSTSQILSMVEFFLGLTIINKTDYFCIEI